MNDPTVSLADIFAWSKPMYEICVHALTSRLDRPAIWSDGLPLLEWFKLKTTPDTMLFSLEAMLHLMCFVDEKRAGSVMGEVLLPIAKAYILDSRCNSVLSVLRGQNWSLMLSCHDDVLAAVQAYEKADASIQKRKSSDPALTMHTELATLIFKLAVWARDKNDMRESRRLLDATQKAEERLNAAVGGYLTAQTALKEGEPSVQTVAAIASAREELFAASTADRTARIHASAYWLNDPVTIANFVHTVLTAIRCRFRVRIDFPLRGTDPATMLRELLEAEWSLAPQA